MSRPKTILVLLAAAMLAACENQDPDGIGQGLDISLGAEIAAHGALTSARAEETGEPVTGYPITAAVWFSNISGDYSTTPIDADTHVPSHITMTFSNSSQVYAKDDEGNNLQYKSSQSEADKVYCVGLYPALGWTWDETSPSAISRDIDGTQDLMFASEIAGDWKNRFASPLTFKHLLTWVKVEAVATSHDAVKQWGKITGLSIDTQPTLNINLADGTTTFTGNDKDMTLLENGSEPLDITSHVVASVFCSPKITYTLKVSTEHFGTISVPVTLNDENGNAISDAASLQGKNVVITLYFGSVIVEGKCVLSAWTEENEDLNK